MKERLVRIAVFYDGNYFLHVSNYYNYDHPRKRRLSLSGLHEFIRNQVAQEEGSASPHYLPLKTVLAVGKKKA